MINKFSIIAALSLILSGLFCSSLAAKVIADSVYKNGQIYTVDSVESWAKAVAIKDGKFIYVGDDAGVEIYIGETTSVTDLQGKMALPGLYDSHVHPVLAAIQQKYEFFFPPTLAGDAFNQALKAYASTATDEWIQGGIWNLNFFGTGGPTKQMLDNVVPDKPIALWDLSHHHVWANSKALEMVGIDKNSAEIPNGEIVRDENGEPTGWLKEKAAFYLASQIPPHSEERYINAAETTTQLLNSVGIVAITDAMVTPTELKAYQSLLKQNKLSLQVAAAIVSDGNGQDEFGLLDKNVEEGALLRTDFVKLFLDGVPFTRTSAMLNAYEGAPDVFGKVFFTQERLNQILVDYDKQGITVKMHSTGDAAVRSSLNAIAAARKQNGDSGLLHQVAHSEFINANDLPRFKQLNAVAEVSPAIWHADVIHAKAITPVLGSLRTQSQWPIHSLIDNGALVTSGSDWPAAAPSPNPWPGLEAMLTREHPNGAFPGALNAEQAIDLSTALKIHTINAAKAVREDNITGSIETGKYANMIVIDRNLFDTPKQQISDTKVLTTVFRGQPVYQAK